MIYYICNKKRDACHENGRTCHPDCYLTSDAEYAANGPCEDPENYPERFNKVNSPDEVIYEEKKSYDKRISHL